MERLEIMSYLNFSIGDKISIENKEYYIYGIIRYKNKDDSSERIEYNLLPTRFNLINSWLSIDTTHNEFSICDDDWCSYKVPKDYILVETGTDCVLSTEGNTNKDDNEPVEYKKYEDITHQKIYYAKYLPKRSSSSNTRFSHEKWHKISPSQIKLLQEDCFNGREPHNRSHIIINCLIIAFLAFFIYSAFFYMPVEHHLKKDKDYSFLTSITEDNKKVAKIYVSSLSMDAVAKDIIDSIEGDAEMVCQSPDETDNSIAILTGDEYCYIYLSNENSNKCPVDATLVQISTRKNTYRYDYDLYNGSNSSNEYFKHFFYFFGYRRDYFKYNSYSSPYDDYIDTESNLRKNDIYYDYWNKVREENEAKDD